MPRTPGQTWAIRPVAAPDSATVAEDAAATPIDVLANDSDFDNDALSVLDVTDPAGGTVEILADNRIRYTPNAGFTGDDSFTYQAEDGNGGVATATVTISITGACSDHGSKSACNNDPACEWTGNPKSGSCQEAATCTVTEDPELTCNDGIDNDCDGLTDSADPDCGVPPANCSLFGDKTSCNAEATCRWDNRNSMCISN